jgi:ribonuclease BN (tRNA processing enzyme)
VNDVKLCFIGTGDSECLNYYNTNVLLEHQGKRLLIDCGWTAKRALNDLGFGITDIDAIYITHVHGDHVFGLERFGFESRYVHQGYRIKLFVPQSVLPLLWDETLKGSMGYSSDGLNTLDDFFDVCVVNDDFVWQGLRFQLFPTPHTQGKPSFGIRLPEHFTFTSDSNVIDGFADLVEGDKYIFHDAYSAGDFHPAHATIEEMRDAYDEALRKRIYLVHYDDAIQKREQALDDFAGIVEQGAVYTC